MSDDESDYYDSNSSSDEESIQNEVLPKKIAKPIEFNHAKQFGNYEEDEGDIDDSEPDDADADDNDDDDTEDENQTGGEKEGMDEDIDVDDSDIELDEEGEPIEKTNKPKSSSKPKKTTQLIIDDVNDEDDEDDEYDENYLQKFDTEITKNYIKEFHAECLNHNYDEVLKLAKVVRDNRNNIIDDLHKTIPYLTKYEKARILGQRAKQIETGAKPFIKVPENIIDSYVIAELELREKKIPFIIKRPIPGGAFEYWHVKDLENISF